MVVFEADLLIPQALDARIKEFSMTRAWVSLGEAPALRGVLDPNIHSCPWGPRLGLFKTILGKGHSAVLLKKCPPLPASLQHLQVLQA